MMSTASVSSLMPFSAANVRTTCGFGPIELMSFIAFLPVVFARAGILANARRGLPLARVRHVLPRRSRRQWLAALEQLDRDVVGRTNESHSSIAWWPIDRHARVG